MTWSLESSIAYECAQEGLSELLAIYMSRLYAEEANPAPRLACLAKLQAEIEEIHRLRRHMAPDDLEAIDRVRKEAAASIQALQSRQRSEKG